MFFFIGLTMAAVQGAYTRGICPGRELAAISQVRGGNAWKRERVPSSADKRGFEGHD